MKKTLDYYMTLRYPIEITEIPAEEGGGISACIPMLGRYSCVADGEKIQEAVDNLKEIKKDLFQDLLDRDIAIPEPIPPKEFEFSGRFLVRMPANLHMRIAEKAEVQGESLNKYIVNALSADIERTKMDSIRELLVYLTKSVESLKAQINSYQIPFTTNTYLGITDISSRGKVNDWNGFPVFAQPNSLIVSQGRPDIFGCIAEIVEPQNTFKFSAFTNTRKEVPEGLVE
jgi:antitoxin HicB